MFWRDSETRSWDVIPNIILKRLILRRDPDKSHPIIRPKSRYIIWCQKWDSAKNCWIQWSNFTLNLKKIKTRGVTSKIQIPADISSDTEQLTNMMQGIDDQDGAPGDCSGVSLPKQAIVVESSIKSKASTCHDEVTTDRGRFPRTLGELDAFITMCHANQASIRHFD